MVYTSTKYDTMPIPVEPAVLSTYVYGAPSGTTDQIVYIPWRRCRLVYAYAVCTVAEGNQGGVLIDFELNATSGTAIGTITIAANSAVGDVDELTIAAGATYDAAGNLDRENTARDAINLEITGAGANTYEGMIYMYFVRDNG
jgi:hypothetical protein